MLESAYEECLCRELTLQGIAYERQLAVPLEYKGAIIGEAYRLDLLVEKSVVVELKTVSKIEPIHEAQLLTYLKLKNLWLGLLMNFNVPILKDGLKRIVN